MFVIKTSISVILFIVALLHDVECQKNKTKTIPTDPLARVMLKFNLYQVKRSLQF